LQKDLPALRDGVGTLGDTIRSLLVDLEGLATETGQQVVAKLRGDARKFSGDLKSLRTAAGEDLLTELPKTRDAIDLLLPQLGSLQDKKAPLVASESLGQSSEVIPRPLDKLIDGTLDLRRTDVEAGDRLELQVSFVGAREGAPDLGDERKQFNYTADVVHTGWYRQFSGDLIFARALKGDAKSFKPNVAASMEWHFYDRDRPDGFLNRLNTGFGLHAANLDQSGSQNVELGAGVNASVFGGLLRVGYGWNLSVSSHRQYVWIGLGLFGALNRLNVADSPPKSEQ
jgi:hypothetical protein